GPPCDFRAMRRCPDTAGMKTGPERARAMNARIGKAQPRGALAPDRDRTIEGLEGILTDDAIAFVIRSQFVVVRQSSGAFHLANDRIERAVRVLRGAEIAQARVRFGGEALQKRGREPRFPDTPPQSD